jgi:hypothetical protein
MGIVSTRRSGASKMGKLVKLIVIIGMLYMGVSLGLKGFSMPNSAAAELCFGLAVTAFIAILIVLNI